MGEVEKYREDGNGMNERLILDYSEGLTKKQKRVFDVLVCPIVASKSINDICLYKNHLGKKVILSSQEYGHTPDEDMCDLAIGFYEILYCYENGKILAQSNQYKSSKEWEIAGDTMNSYNFVAQFVGEEKKKEWHETYHCLANFWCVPANTGRGSKKGGGMKSSGGRKPLIWTVDSFNKGRKDFVDRYLCEEQSINVDEYRKHYLYNAYVSDNNEIIEYSKIKEADSSEIECNYVTPIIEQMMNSICKRAVSIVKDEEKCNQLFEYFNLLNIIG